VAGLRPPLVPNRRGARQLVAKSEKTNGRIILQNDFKKSKKIEEAQDYDDRWDKQNEPRLLSSSDDWLCTCTSATK
jgi:hypothetical protein